MHDLFGLLLELFRTDFVTANPSWIEHAPRRNLTKSLRKQLRVHQVPLKGLLATPVPEYLWDTRYLHLVTEFRHEAVLIKGQLVHDDIVSSSDSSEKVPQSHVE